MKNDESLLKRLGIDIDTINKEAGISDGIKIYKWDHKCWKCDKITTLVTYSFCYDFTFKIGSIEKLDLLLQENYEWVKKKYSNTRQDDCIANTCIHCGSLQGNFFVTEQYIELATTVDIEDFVDIVIDNPLDLDDFDLDYLKEKYFNNLEE